MKNKRVIWSLLDSVFTSKPVKAGRKYGLLQALLKGAFI